MGFKKWDEIRLSRSQDDPIWELFHENSKITRYYRAPSDQEYMSKMQRMYESLEFKGYEEIKLPKPKSLTLPLEDALTNRVTARGMVPCLLTLEEVATILYYSYGITRENRDTIFPRPFRVVPSGGALYPLEIFLHSTNIEGHAQGIYHYNPTRNILQFLKKEDKTSQISESLVQKDIAYEASLVIFITAMFKRSVFKYSDRGYRFILLEAGHVAQNMNIVTQGLGLGCINIGGYFDHKVDDLLELDGITHSTIYIAAIGKKKMDEYPTSQDSSIL